jgi:hypothetical protein
MWNLSFLKLRCVQVENVFTTLHGERARIARRKFEAGLPDGRGHGQITQNRQYKKNIWP